MRERTGFTLLHLSLLLAVTALVLMAVLPGGNKTGDEARARETLQRIKAIEEVSKGFMAARKRRPCPASGTFASGDPHFGIEAANPGSCIGGTPASDFAAAGVVAGVVPVRTLGLPDNYAFDGWGRRIEYVVDQRATGMAACAAAGFTSGGIVIKSTVGGKMQGQAMALYISHGKKGHGAFPANGSSVQGRVNSGSTDPDILANASVDAAFAPSFTPIFIKKERDAYFDDVVWAPEYTPNTCCLGANCYGTGSSATSGTSSTSSSTSGGAASSSSGSSTASSTSGI